MIDWLTLGLYLDSDAESRSLPCDILAVLKPGGEVSLVRDIRFPVPGSHDDKVYVSRASIKGYRPGFKGLCPGLVISGNPAKFFQGHNVFGSDDCKGLAIDLAQRVVELLEFPLTETERRVMGQGLIRLTRVDCTSMLDYGTNEEARAVLHHLGRVGSLSRRRGSDTATMHGDTVYFGEHSRRWQLKGYPKGLEIQRKGHELSERLSDEDRRRLFKYAQGSVRLELELKALEIERRGLGIAWGWTRDMGPWKESRCLRT
jgi:II/X family phage/plasmid replication protein